MINPIVIAIGVPLLIILIYLFSRPPKVGEATKEFSEAFKKDREAELEDARLQRKESQLEVMEEKGMGPLAKAIARGGREAVIHASSKEMAAIKQEEEVVRAEIKGEKREVVEEKRKAQHAGEMKEAKEAQVSEIDKAAQELQNKIDTTPDMDPEIKEGYSKLKEKYEEIEGIVREEEKDLEALKGTEEKEYEKEKEIVGAHKEELGDIKGEEKELSAAVEAVGEGERREALGDLKEVGKDMVAEDRARKELEIAEKEKKELERKELEELKRLEEKERREAEARKEAESFREELNRKIQQKREEEERAREKLESQALAGAKSHLEKVKSIFDSEIEYAEEQFQALEDSENETIRTQASKFQDTLYRIKDKLDYQYSKTEEDLDDVRDEWVAWISGPASFTTVLQLTQLRGIVFPALEALGRMDPSHLQNLDSAVEEMALGGAALGKQYTLEGNTMGSDHTKLEELNSAEESRIAGESKGVIREAIETEKSGNSEVFNDLREAAEGLEVEVEAPEEAVEEGAPEEEIEEEEIKEGEEEEEIEGLEEKEVEEEEEEIEEAVEEGEEEMEEEEEIEEETPEEEGEEVLEEIEEGGEGEGIEEEKETGGIEEDFEGEVGAEA